MKSLLKAQIEEGQCSGNRKIHPRSQFAAHILHVFVATAGLAFNLEVAAGEKDTIVTDRPDFVESSNVVGKARFQLETSIALDRNSLSKIRERTILTPTLLRFGISDDLELRAETDGRMISRSEDKFTGKSDTQKGYSDLSLGVKWHALDASGSGPSVGILAHVDLETGTSSFRGNGARPSLRIAAEWELPNDFSLGVMPGFISQKNEFGERYISGIFGIVLGKAWNDNFRTFIEFATPQIASTRNGGTLATFDIGAAYLISNAVQIDTAISKGLNKNTVNLSWTIGISMKF